MRRLDRIAALVDDALAAGLGSAAAVSVGDAGVEIFRLTRGYTRRVPDRGEPIDDHTPFDLASLTKPMATVAIAMVDVADGLLDLDSKIGEWWEGARSAGTIRQLLAHCAGCAAHVEFFHALRGARPHDPHLELVRRAAREPCDPPGVAAVYSDLGFILLGGILGHTLAYEFESKVAMPLELSARYAFQPIEGAVATELDERGLVCGLVHDENAYYGGRALGHAGLFGSIDDVAKFAAAMVALANGERRGRFDPDVVRHFFTDAPLPGSPWRLGWDTPSPVPGVSQAGDRWPRTHAVGHTGFTGTSLWLDLANRRWCALLTNRVHPTRHAGTADAIKTLRRAVNDVVIDALS